MSPFASAIWRPSNMVCRVRLREALMRIVCISAVMLLAVSLPAEAGIAVRAWGGVEGQGVDLYTLTNARGMEAKITNYGAVITAIRVPGRDGKLADVVQGFGRLEDY